MTQNNKMSDGNAIDISDKDSSKKSAIKIPLIQKASPVSAINFSGPILKSLKDHDPTSELFTKTEPTLSDHIQLIVGFGLIGYGVYKLSE